jgi:hypothetical protein
MNLKVGADFWVLVDVVEDSKFDFVSIVRSRLVPCLGNLNKRSEIYLMVHICTYLINQS